MKKIIYVDDSNEKGGSNYKYFPDMSIVRRK